MTRSIVMMACLVGAACAAAVDEKDKDPVKEKLFAAKVAYDKEMAQFRTAAGEWLDKREDDARKDGNKKLVEQVQGERKAFDEEGVLPKSTPANIQQKLELTRKALEAAYSQAVKDYIKAKQDDEAVAVEKALLDFRKENWRHVDLTYATVRDDYIRISPQARAQTVQNYTGAVEIVVVARTESENIRLDAQKGALVIFNWEVNPRELRVCRPDGSDKLESGSVVTAKVTPLKPNTWYTIKWRLTEEGMQISVDGKIVFEEKRRYDLTATAPIIVRTVKSPVDLKEFRVTPVKKDR